MHTALSTPRSLASTASAASLPRRILLGLAATLVVAAAAHISFPLPFTPVPLTLQPLAVLGVGLALGPVDGFFALLAYLAEGCLGLPVFAPDVITGAAALFAASGGFLMAYPAVAALAGGLTHLLERRQRPFVAALLACTAAVVLLFVCGASWFMFGAPTLLHLPHFSLETTWIEAVAPFLPGEAVKICAAAGIYSTLKRRRSV